jgi:hypothetical protein
MRRLWPLGQSGEAPAWTPLPELRGHPGGDEVTSPGTLADLIASGELDGYVAGAPARGWIDGPGLDRAICAEARCEHCGTRGLTYRPFTAPGSYRAFACCPACGAADEF